MSRDGAGVSGQSCRAVPGAESELEAGQRAESGARTGLLKEPRRTQITLHCVLEDRNEMI